MGCTEGAQLSPCPRSPASPGCGHWALGVQVYTGCTLGRGHGPTDHRGARGDMRERRGSNPKSRRLKRQQAAAKTACGPGFAPVPMLLPYICRTVTLEWVWTTAPSVTPRQRGYSIHYIIMSRSTQRTHRWPAQSDPRLPLSAIRDNACMRVLVVARGRQVLPLWGPVLPPVSISIKPPGSQVRSRAPPLGHHLCQQ